MCELGLGRMVKGLAPGVSSRLAGKVVAGLGCSKCFLSVTCGSDGSPTRFACSSHFLRTRGAAFSSISTSRSSF